MSLDTSHVRSLLSPHGEVASQSSDQWTGPFPLPTLLVDFYRDVGPLDVSIEGYGNPTFLPSLRRLWDYQEGYRWNSGTGEPSSDWDDDWIVVADEGADPFIFSRARGCILHAVHGNGVWEPEELFPNILTMTACMAELGNVRAEAGRDFLDDDCIVRPQHRKLAVARLSPILGDKSLAEIAVASAGWG